MPNLNSMINIIIIQNVTGYKERQQNEWLKMLTQIIKQSVNKKRNHLSVQSIQKLI